MKIKDILLVIAVLFIAKCRGGGTGRSTRLAIHATPIDFSSFVCSPVTITCMAVNLPSLTFYIGHQILAIFQYSRSASIPAVIYDSDGIRIVVTEVTDADNVANVFSGTAVLTSTTLALSRLNADTIHCGSNGVYQTPFINIKLNVHATPIFYRFVVSPYLALFFLSILTPNTGNRNAIIRWSPFFTSQHAVERYRVSVSPDPSSCSSDHVSPSGYYTCPELLLGLHYNFEISAFLGNCSGVEGDRASFTISPPPRGILAVNVEEARITSSLVDYNATTCFPLTITCSTQGLLSLTFFFNRLTLASFVYLQSVSLPLVIHDHDGVRIVVTEAIPRPGNSRVFGGIAVLTSTTLALKKLNVDSIQCGSDVAQSQSIDVRTSVHVTPIFNHLLDTLNGVLVLTIQWNPDFTYEHSVDFYRVAVSPDPNSCSNDQVNPYFAYHCRRLVPGTRYNVTVSVFPRNCGGLEGNRTSFIVSSQGPPNEPDITYKDGSLCFIAYSHVDAPVQNYTVKVTDIMGATISLGTYNASGNVVCVDVFSSLGRHACSPLSASVTAANAIGMNSSLIHLSGSDCDCHQRQDPVNVTVSHLSATSVDIRLDCGTNARILLLRGDAQVFEMFVLRCGENNIFNNLAMNTVYLVLRSHSHQTHCILTTFATTVFSTTTSTATDMKYAERLFAETTAKDMDYAEGLFAETTFAKEMLPLSQSTTPVASAVWTLMLVAFGYIAELA